MANFPYRKTEYRGFMNPFWIEPAKKDVMGYKLTGVKAGDVIPQGTPIKTDEAAKTAVICKYAHVLAVDTDKKTLTVKRGHFFDKSTKCAISNGGTLTQLSLASVEDDKIVLSAVNNTIKAGDVLVEVATSGESTVAPVAVPNRIVAAEAEIDELHDTSSATHAAVVLQNVVHYPKEYLNETAFPGSMLLAGCPTILFTIQ